MKTNLTFGKKFHATILATLLGAGAYLCQAAPKPPPSPVLTSAVGWDCVISGINGEQGIVYLTFTTNTDAFGNYTFDLRQIHTRVLPSTGSNNSGGRNPGGGAGRGDGSTAGSNGSTNGMNIFGFWSAPRNGVPPGSWGFDSKGNTVGFYIELIISSGVGSTNIVTITNQVSFIAKITPNKRLTAIYSSSLGGNGTFQGVPIKPLTDLSGHWTGDEINAGVSTYEFFTLSGSGFPNIYDLNGSGPGYAISNGVCMVSSQKKIAFADYKFYNATNAAYVQRGTVGPLINSTRQLGGNTKGIADPGASVNYNAFWVSP